MFCISKIIDKHKNNEEALSIPFDYIFNFQDRYDVYGLNIRENEEQILTDDSLHYLSLKKQIQGVDRHIITVSDEVLISFMKSIEYYKSVFVRINTDEFSRGLFITDYQDFYFYRNNGDKPFISILDVIRSDIDATCVEDDIFIVFCIHDSVVARKEYKIKDFAVFSSIYSKAILGL